MNPLTAWRAIHQYGGKLTLHNGTLHYCAPGTIPDTVLGILRANRNLLTELLQAGWKAKEDSPALTRARVAWHTAEMISL
jgi:hypothetical protein